MIKQQEPYSESSKNAEETGTMTARSNVSVSSTASESESLFWTYGWIIYAYTAGFIWALWLNYCLFVHRCYLIIRWFYDFSIFAYKNPKAGKQVIQLTMSTIWMNVKLAWVTYRHGFWSFGGFYYYWVAPTPVKAKPKKLDSSKKVAPVKKKID